MNLRPLEQLMADDVNPNNPAIITACLALSRSVSAEWLQTHLVTRILGHPRFASVLQSDSDGKFHFELLPEFTASSPDLMHHHVITESVIDVQLSYEERYQLFERHLSQILSTPLDLNRPLWKIHLFPQWTIVKDKSTVDGGCMVVIRVHHSISDGIGLVKFFMARLVDGVKLQERPSEVLVEPRRHRDGVAKGRNGELRPTEATDSGKRVGRPAVVKESVGTLRRIVETFEDLYLSIVGTLSPDSTNVFTRSEIQREKVCALMPPSQVTVEMLKEAGRVLGVTLNDLLFTAVSGACRRYLKKTGESVERLKGIRCAIPFNGHRFDSFAESDIGNEFALVLVDLHVEEEDRLERLRKCVLALRRVKRSQQFAMVMAMLRLVATLPRRLRLGLWRHLTRAASILFTNVPGPKKLVEVGGVRVDSLHFFAPADGHAGVVVGLFSYGGQIALGVAGDKGRIRDPGQFVSLLSEELDALIDVGKIWCSNTGSSQGGMREST